MRNELIENLEKIHTTELGIDRIKKNLSLNVESVVAWCKLKIAQKDTVLEQRGKNWYVTVDGVVITINAYSYTIITAHKKK